jgi:hypothetical protein
LHSTTDSNTIAHRLQHLSLSTEIVQFRLEQKTNSDTAEHLKEMVEAVEMDTEITRHRHDPEHR